MNSALDNKVRILIIDDNASIHGDFQRIFKDSAPPSSLDAFEAELFGGAAVPSRSSEAERGFSLTMARQGEEGVDLVRQAWARGEPYAVVFVDIRMRPASTGSRRSTRSSR